MNPCPILPLSRAPLLVGLDPEGSRVHVICLSPLNALELVPLEHRSLGGLGAFQEFWMETVEVLGLHHDHVAVAVPRLCEDPHGVVGWLHDLHVHVEEYPVLLRDEEWVAAETGIWNVPQELAPALGLAQTAMNRRFGGQISCHLWLEMQNLQDEMKSMERRLRRLMLSQLDSPHDDPLEVPF